MKIIKKFQTLIIPFFLQSVAPLLVYILICSIFSSLVVLGLLDNDARHILTDIQQESSIRTLLKPKFERYGVIERVEAIITAYNTVESQTDQVECVSASGVNICGRDYVVACPRRYPFGTLVRIDGKVYTCYDRTALKNEGIWDISYDKDVNGALEWGRRTMMVEILQK